MLTAVVALGWIAISRPRPETTAPSELGAMSHAGKVEADSPAPRVAHSRLSESRVGELRVVATHARDGSPAVGVLVEALPFDDASGRRRRLAARTDDRGEVRFPNVPDGPVRIVAGGSSSYWRLDPERQNVVAVELAESRRATGIVVDAGGSPVPGAEIWISSAGARDRGDVACVAGPDGRFDIRHLGSGHLVAARAGGLAWSGLLEVPADPTPPAELRVVLGERSRTIRGIVVDEGGAAVAVAWIGCRRAAGGVPMIETVSDRSGCFELGGLGDGEWSVEAWSEGHAPTTLRMRTSSSEDVVAVLRRGVSLLGRVADELGRSLPGIVVTVEEEGTIGGARATVSADDGTFRIDHVADGRVLARAGYLAGSPVREALDLRSGRGGVWNTVIPSENLLRGVVVDEQGKGRAFACIRASSQSRGGAWMAETIADRLGRFELPGCPDEPLAVAVDVARWGDGATWTIRNARPDTKPLTVMIPDRARPSSFIAGRVHGPDGAPLIGASIVASPLRGPHDFQKAAMSRTPDGSFRIGPLAPGDYVVEAVGPGRSRIALGECALATEEDLHLGDVAMEREGFLRVLLRRAERAPVTQRLVVVDRRSRPVAALRPVSGFAMSGPVGPGRYVLLVDGAGVSPAELPFEIAAGETTTLEVAIEAAR
jgi:hypothetical protein